MRTSKIVDAMTTDLAKAEHYLKVARSNVERGRLPLAAMRPELWEEVVYVESELGLLIDKIKKERELLYLIR
jgi:hypothetical protein